MVPTIMAKAGAVTTLGDRPLYVLTAPVDAQTGWLTPQMDMAALSSNSVHLVVAGADPRITARRPNRRSHDQPGNHRGRRRHPNRHLPELNRGAEIHHIPVQEAPLDRTPEPGMETTMKLDGENAATTVRADGAFR